VGKAAAGWGWGFLGVLGFSWTLPMTAVAIPWFGPTIVGFGRAVLAALAAAALLAVRREPFPHGAWRELMGVVIGVVLGFPWLAAWALTRVPAAHGAVMLALLPLATAAVAAWRAGERMPRTFWAASALGSATVIAYALRDGTGGLQMADAALLGAVALAAWGYAEGGRLARRLGGWRVISWALVLSLPVTVGPVLWVGTHRVEVNPPPAAWGSLAYLAFVSQLTAFFAWYHGLAVGGVSRISQLQYMQVFLTLAWSHWWLGEPVTGLTVAAAVLVVGAVAWGQREALRQAGVGAVGLGRGTESSL
jgi:drug/metabolite transporter (DMT)-like permease